jgi:neutral ceramidase
VPIGVYRIGDGAIAAVPGESTKQVGTEIRARVARALAPAGVRHVIIAGLANDYIQYITTPAEYGWQSYEGASTLYGPNEGTFFEEQLGALAGDLAAGRSAPAPASFDPSYGVRPDGPPYPVGADHGTATAQPAPAVARLKRVAFAWDGGPSGHDRPVDRAFVHAQRRVHGHWHEVASDLGLEFLWRVDTHGHYTAEWEVPLNARRGTYRLRVTATRYALNSRPFHVVASHALRVQAVPGGVRLAYPPAIVDVDLTARPVAAHGGAVTYGGHTVRRRRATVFPVPAGTTIAAGAARDRYGNTN